ncbi:hypothetical protein [Calothrix sp. PCC 6303]|nr:hypothetical protein [Calothrix sp. PCC 6303]
MICWLSIIDRIRGEKDAMYRVSTFGIFGILGLFTPVDSTMRSHF